MGFKIKYIDLKKQHANLGNQLYKKIKKIFLNSHFILRNEVANFERSICKLLKVKYCVGLNSGTDALLMGLSQLQLKKDDEVITVSHTYIATVSAILHVGAVPVYVDIDESFNINPNLIEKKISKKTKAILVVHLNGRCCDMSKISSIAKKYNLKIIEDCAQALGSKYKNKFAGTFGIAGAFSLHPMKTLSVPGDGGFLITNNKKVYRNICLLRDHGRDRKTNLKKCFGFNSRLDNLHAAIALVKLPKFKNWVIKRRKIALRYSENLKNLKKISLPLYDGKNYYDTFNSYVIRVKKRDMLKLFLLRSGIEVFSHIDKGVHLENFSKTKVALPQTEKIEKEILSLPIYPELSLSKVDFISNKIKIFCEQ